MAVLKKNPHLPDYFTLMDGIRVSSPLADVPSLIEAYEEPRVLYFPDLKPRIDFDFWASIDTDRNLSLRKFVTTPSIDFTPDSDGAERLKRVERAGVDDPELAARLAAQIGAVLDQILPIYGALFKGYRFQKGHVCWRLNTIHAENLHVDTYKVEQPYHFARMFINLDNQPRIWHTSWRAQEVIERAAGRISQEQYEQLPTNELWAAFNKSVFGRTSLEWWDDQPRHIAFFEPGDVWVVDSRLVAHQIFYGRRAVSIDFFVHTDSMLSPDLHYLRIAEAARMRLRSQAAPRNTTEKASV